jgi:CheY-like chemotaxis protein
MRASLRASGFPEVDAVSSREELDRKLRSRSPDLCLFGCEDAGDETCKLLREIRAGAVTSNPFLVILVAYYCSDGEIVPAFRNAGADAALSFPISDDELGEVVARQISGRKRFVATSDYIGPDRRRDPSRSGGECFDVLNSLRLKSYGLAAEEAEARIANDLKLSLVRLNAERQRQNVLQLCVLWRLLEQRRAGTPDFLGTVQRMRVICEDIENRVAEAYAGTAKSLCESVQVAIDALEAGLRIEQTLMGKRRPDLSLAIERLGRAALNLGELYVPGALAPSKLFELDELVAKVGIRRCRDEALAPGPEPERATSRAAII